MTVTCQVLLLLAKSFETQRITLFGTIITKMQFLINKILLNYWEHYSIILTPCHQQGCLPSFY